MFERLAKIGKSIFQGIAEANQKSAYQKPKLMTLEDMRKEVDSAGGNTEKLQGIVQNHIESILAMLEGQQKKIEIAKKKGEYAQDISKKDTIGNSIKQAILGGFFGINIQEERAKATVEGLVATNKAMEEMNKVLQGIVALTCCSMLYAKIMIESMGGILTEGFVNAAGQRQQLSESQKKLVEQLLFTTKQHAMKDMKDMEQDEKINQLFEFLAKKDEIDLEQSEQIGKNAELIAQNQQNIFALQKRNTRTLAILAWIAILLSLVSLGVSLADKF